MSDILSIREYDSLQEFTVSLAVHQRSIVASQNSALTRAALEARVRPQSRLRYSFRAEKRV